jgi:hypothetical protein
MKFASAKPRTDSKGNSPAHTITGEGQGNFLANASLVWIPNSSSLLPTLHMILAKGQ